VPVFRGKCLTMQTRHVIRLVQFAAWASIAVIAYFTLARVGVMYSIYFKLSPYLMRPHMHTYAHFEHVIVFAMFGAIFGFAYPRHVLLVCSVVFGTAVALELLQTVTPDRHGTLMDALDKIAGGAFGILFAKTALNFWDRRRSVQPDA
jgi:hypothetical protein